MATIKTIIRKGLLIVLSIFLLIIIAGYAFTFYKEHIRSLTTPAAIKSTTIDNNEMTYLAYGDKNNQPVVLFHGTGANSFIWEKTSQILADNGYYVIALDIPPFGWTSISNDHDYRKEVQASKITNLLKSLQVVNPILVGHSFNSKIALQVASTYESKKLIFIAPVLDYEAKQDPSFVGKLFSISVLRDPVLSLFVNNTLLAKKILQSFMYVKEADVDSQLMMTTLPFNKKGVNHAYGEWFQEFFNERSTVDDALTLKEVHIPVYALWGDKDTIASIHNWEKLQVLSKEAVLTTLKGVGHMPHLEDIALFNKKLLEVLEK